ncbi:MAG: metal-dependent phosphohydrolase, partial [Candidatus Marinimicrobia bacterium]|nr:metal-dependent phosphohydrolase [Candidatus Neomarinimicrobiota bacterium]
LVELSTGEVGVVIQQSKIRRLKPRVMIILNKDKVSNDYFPIIDLLTADKDEDGQPYEIKKSIKPEDYGIDPVKYYL